MQKNISVLIHNIRSTHNVGSMFRTADCAGVSHIYISGYSPTPVDRFNRPRKDVAKVALGAEKTIPWEFVDDVTKLLKQLKKDGVRIVALEQTDTAVDYKKVKIDKPTLVIVGNEVDGVDADILAYADVVAEIPQFGEKESLNVSVAFGVALFRMLGI